ncbi:MAG TPA: hypothetical protein VKD65_09980 [Candidatus Angelobacter sp.]|nr:hypothetical protein [Candidatus Angelobacter sp.]
MLAARCRRQFLLAFLSDDRRLNGFDFRVGLDLLGRGLLANGIKVIRGNFKLRKSWNSQQEAQDD